MFSGCLSTEKRKTLALVLIIAAVFVTVTYFYLNKEKSSATKPNIEASAKVVEVQDGDSLTVKIEKIRDPHKDISSGKDEIRLAKIDAEEMSLDKAKSKHKDVQNLSRQEYRKTAYYRKALEEKKFLKTKIPKNTKIFLDFDDLAKGNGPYYKPYRGNYGRIIAIAYIKENKKWINLNATLMEKYYPKYLNKTGFKSEFNPETWLEKDYPYISHR